MVNVMPSAANDGLGGCWENVKVVAKAVMSSVPRVKKLAVWLVLLVLRRNDPFRAVVPFSCKFVRSLNPLEKFIEPYRKKTVLAALVGIPALKARAVT